MGRIMATEMCLGGVQTEEQKVAKIRSKVIDQAFQTDQKQDESIKKLLLLGAGESGKSTLFKQMITLYGKGYSEEDRKGYTNVVYSNVISAIKTLVEKVKVLSPNEVTPADHFVASRDFIETLKPESDEINVEVAEHIKNLWLKDDGIKRTFEDRAKFQFPDSAPYFFERIDEIAKSDYIPDEQDVLRSRVRTTGIVETEFEIDGNNFKMFDVGGQRNERKKWIHCFENVTSVIFVAAISEYNQMLFEDETTNRMVEALNLFDEICNSRWFRETSMILFLNKRDLFEEKIKEVALKNWFPDYDGPDHDSDRTCQFLKELFEMKNRNKDKEVYTHITCATDKDNISHVFNSVKDTIIKRTLREGLWGYRYVRQLRRLPIPDDNLSTNQHRHLANQHLRPRAPTTTLQPHDNDNQWVLKTRIRTNVI